MSEQNTQNENIRDILVRSLLNGGGNTQNGVNNVHFREENKESENSDTTSESVSEDEMYTKELEILYVLAKNNSKMCEALLSIVRNE